MMRWVVRQVALAVAIAAAALSFLLPMVPLDWTGGADMRALAVTLAFRLSAAVVAFCLLLLALRLDDAWRRKRGYKGGGFFDAQPLPQAIYLGLRYLACALLVGLALG